MLIIGIDPGLRGAVAFLKKGQIINLFEMPIMSEGKKNKNQLNNAQLAKIMKENIDDFSKATVVVEKVNAMPGQGVTSMFNFGQSFGILKGVCSAMNLSMHFVRPAKWKKHFNLINASKDASRTKAIEIFPYFSINLSKKKDANKADAILIASYFDETFIKN